MSRLSRPIERSALTSRTLWLAFSVVVLMVASSVGTAAPPAKSIAAPNSSQSWTNRSSTSGPSGISYEMMAYDVADRYVVMFGGVTQSGWSNQTWKYVGGTWTQLYPTHHPPVRAQGMMAYDSRDHYVVLYGGWGPGGVDDNDTWTFSAGQWTDITNTSGGMPALEEGGMSYDSHLGRVVFFGGWTDPCSCVDWPSYATYGFSSGSWTQLFPNHRAKGTASLAPQGASIAYDARDGYLVKFGGWDNKATNATTWNLTRGHWTELNTSRSPSWRVDECLVFDSRLGHVIMFGGTSVSTGSRLNDTWKYVGGTWTQLHPTSSPPFGVATGAAYDAADGYILLFEGHSTWTYG